MNSSYSRGMSEAAKDTGAVLIAAFEGWNDACQAATNAVRHLVKRYESREIRHIKCDDFYDYQVARPMLCHVSGRTNLIWPQTTFYDITLDAGKHIYAQIAPEPNYRWKEYCSQSLAIADELDVNRIITLGSMFPGWGPTLVAMVISFVLGYIVIIGFLKFVSNFSYKAFAIYRIGLAVVVALLLIVGVLPAIDPSVVAAA